MGGQYRDVKSREDIPDSIYNGSLACEWPSEFTSGNGVGRPNLPASPEAFAANASDDIERRRAQRRIALLDEWTDIA